MKFITFLNLLIPSAFSKDYIVVMKEQTNLQTFNIPKFKNYFSWDNMHKFNGFRASLNISELNFLKDLSFVSYIVE